MFHPCFLPIQNYITLLTYFGMYQIFTVTLQGRVWQIIFSGGSRDQFGLQNIPRYARDIL